MARGGAWGRDGKESSGRAKRVCRPDAKGRVWGRNGEAGRQDRAGRGAIWFCDALHVARADQGAAASCAALWALRQVPSKCETNTMAGLVEVAYCCWCWTSIRTPLPQEKKQLVFEGTVGRDVEALGRLTEDDLRFLFG